MPTVIQFRAPVRCISQGNLLAEGTGEHAATARRRERPSPRRC